MKKTSSKIIISVLLAVLLWSGVGFNFQKTADYQNNKSDIKISILIEKAYAAPSISFTPSTTATSSKSLWEKFKSGVFFVTDTIGGLKNIASFSTTYGLLYVVGIIQAFWVTVSAAVFDGMMILSIQKFPDIVANSGVEIAWSVLRNIINISFIFILLYIAITTILGNIGPKAKSTIAKVIVAAILINFSLFFVRIMIDASNILAVSLYNYTGFNLSSFSSELMGALDLQSLWNIKNVTFTGQTSTLFLLSLQVILMFFVIWAFALGAFMLLGRMIMLLILMTLSPIAFLNDAIPGLGKKASEWWSAFVGQLMVAPAFMFILIIVAQLLNNREIITNLSDGLFDVNGGYSGNFSVGPIIYYVIIIGILLGGIKMVKKLSGVVGGFAEKAFNTLLAITIAAISGGTSALAARGAGMAARGSAMAARGMAAQMNGGGAAAARATRVGLDLQRRGQRMQTAANIITTPSRVFNNAAAQPNALGTTLTSIKENFFKTTKKETGVDLDAAFKYREKVDKEYEKRYGDIANKIGGKKEREELDILKNISTNIKNQAQSRHERQHKAEWDRQKTMPVSTDVERTAKKAELTRLENEVKAMMPNIAQEMGVNLSEHNARQDELKVIIENKTIEKNQYAAKIPNKKIADMIRSKATYEAKDDVSKTLKKLFKDAKIDLPDSSAPKPPATPAP